ncbi:hypothetical protein E2C01_044527 [Portunus trituberculatus]|uniref:Uncharacterized protein n=1 Tax=Portunus trituberculatus TaxID=210409 RepID=A0A5B7FZ91_PORTR|nr:hypothetical protein [Portunus trituberculatus]
MANALWRASFGSRRVLSMNPHPQLMGLLEGAVPSKVHLLGLGRCNVGLYTSEPDVWQMLSFWPPELEVSAPRCRYYAGTHQSSRCLEKIQAGTKIPLCCCNCSGEHNANSRPCPARLRPFRRATG